MVSDPSSPGLNISFIIGKREVVSEMGVEIKENEMSICCLVFLFFFFKIQTNMRSDLSSKIRRFPYIISKKQCLAR